MHRRFGFLISVCGMMFAVMPLATVLRRPDFVTLTVGSGLFLLGVFVAIESVARKNDQKS